MLKAIACLNVCLILLGGACSQAMPPRPGTAEPAEVIRLKAKLGIDRVDDPIRDRGKKGMFNSALTGYQLLVSGGKRMPCVLMDYTDFSSAFSRASFDSMLFDTTESWPGGSAHDYFTLCSYGKFSLNGNVHGWFSTDTTRTYYSGGSYGFGGSFPQNAGGLVWLAAELSDPGVDYSQYDNDDDGYVDCLWVVHAWYGAEESQNTADIWSHSWALNRWTGGEVFTTNDPWPGHPGEFIKIDRYIIMPERSGLSSINHYGMVSIGVFCHEFGHNLGLPDLYDTGYGGEGLGHWCLMSGGSWGGNGASPWLPVHLCSWAKGDLGWVEPTVISADGYYDIPLWELIPQSYRLSTGGAPTAEYFLIENRQTIQQDAFLPGNGLLIYHIDENVIAQYRPSNRVNYQQNGVYGVTLEEADGAMHLFYGANSGDINDPFPGGTNNTAFDSLGTTPDSRTNGGENTHCGVNSIPPSFGLMTPYFYVGTATGVGGNPGVEELPVIHPSVKTAPNPFRETATVRLEGWPKAANVRVVIYNVLGQPLRTLTSEGVDHGTRSIRWNGVDEKGQRVKPGIYILRAESGKTLASSRVLLLP